jgi:hypothetical protein
MDAAGTKLESRSRRVGGRAGGRAGREHSLVIFDRHAKLPIASGSVPLTTGATAPQST